DPVREAEPRRERHHAGARARALLAVGDHVLGEERGAGGGARHVDAPLVQDADRLRAGGAAEHGAEAELDPSRGEGPRRFFKNGELLGVLALLSALEVDDRDLGSAEILESLLVPASGRAKLGGGRNDGDVGVAPATDLDEALQYLLGADLVFGAPDGNDVASR